MLSFLAVMCFFGFIAFIVGLIGLIVAAVRKKKRKPWVITLIVGFVCFWAFLIIFGILDGDFSSSDEEVVEETAIEEEPNAVVEETSEEEVAEDEEAIEDEEASEKADAAVVKKTAEKTEPEWALSGDTKNCLDISVVSGNKKSVTLKFECVYEDSTDASAVFQMVAIGGHKYTASQDFDGLPLQCKVDGKQYDNLLGGADAKPGKAQKMTITMKDGGKLPKSFVIYYDSVEYYESLGKNQQDKIENQKLVLTRGKDK